MVNPDLFIDWDAVKKQDDIESIQRSINDVKNIQVLQLRVSEALTELYSGEELAKAKLYEGAITRFLLDNIKEEELTKNIRNLVNVYYRILTDKNVSIMDYLYLEKHAKVYSNEIKSYLENKYQESKNDLLYYADLFEVECGDLDNDTILEQIMVKYEDRNVIARLYQKVIAKCKRFGDSSDRVVAAEIKKIKDAYETVVTLRTNNVYRIKTDRELKTMIINR